MDIHLSQYLSVNHGFSLHYKLVLSLQYLKEHYDDSAFDEVDGDDYAEIKKLCRDVSKRLI